MVTQSFLLHSRQPESKTNKAQLLQNRVLMKREQEVEFSLGNTTEGHRPTLLSFTRLAYLALDQTTQLHKPGANSCQGTSSASTASAASHQRDREMLLSGQQPQIPGTHCAKREGSSTVPPSSN